MSKETMTAEVKEAIAKAEEFAETGAPEKVTGTVEPANSPKAGEQSRKTGQKKQVSKKPKKDGKAEVATKEDKKIQLALSREFNKRSGIIEKNLASIENSFLTIAFNLHWIKKNGMHKTAGFKNIYDYAENTHGIGRTTCSNLICIIENFAERNENGEVMEKIAECYRKFKQSQLVAMMGLSPEQIARIDEKTSVRTINQMKRDTEIIQEDDGDSNNGADTEPGADEGRQEPAKKYINTLIQFNNYEKYQKELEEIDALVERAFKKSTLPVTIKIVCEQG